MYDRSGGVEICVPYLSELHNTERENLGKVREIVKTQSILNYQVREHDRIVDLNRETPGRPVSGKEEMKFQNVESISVMGKTWNRKIR